MLLAINIIAGLTISAYNLFNAGFTSIVIIINAVLLCLLGQVHLKSSFIVSLSFLFSIIGLGQFILGCICPPKFMDNGYIIAALVLFLIELGVFMICGLISRKVR